jgi:hypothetical protein
MALYYTLAIFCDYEHSERCHQIFESDPAPVSRAAELKAKAKRSGWQQRRHEVHGALWACPECVLELAAATAQEGK